MAAAHAFFAQDQGTTFNLEYTWRLLKDEPKWMGESIGSSLKITKTSGSGASSENPNTPSAKRKGKANEIPTAKQDEGNKRTTAMERLAQCKEDEIEVKKCTSAIRMLAHGSPADSVDEYVRIGESTSIECLQRFVQGVNAVFEAEYLRKPNNIDVEHLLQMGESRGFPSMLGSIDCMHWEWKNCPVAWKGQYCRGDHGKPTIMLEAVASQDLWIWHDFFGIAGSNNDVNVLNQSNVFNDILEGHAPNVQYTINETSYNMGYYLADGIYPEWATFVKTISMPQGEKKKLFAQHQESARKDVERTFGVLQSRFAIIHGPARAWHMETLKYTIYVCIILHNMIVEDERHTYGDNFDYSYDNVDNNNSTTEIFSGPHPNLATRLQRRASIREKQVHHQLQGDLVEYVRERFGHEDDEI
ncbi:uncharacterized protein LOC131621623 [Vicia villosa]|uniref:uncharacterized protein LOC131621623 n=1 Tax=Vicia villosa TaxID=3911 RepID=UPI00273AB62F|nr:uncharacterized protein LOC131621623 [Vicia villosa]